MEYRLSLVVNGGGTRIIPRLFARPGASARMLEASVPYHPAALEQYLGGPVTQACSESTARSLAVAAFQRAGNILKSESLPSGTHPLGVACTAALATNRNRRGDDRAFVAVHAVERTITGKLNFGNQQSDRDFQENATADLVQQAIDRATDNASANPAVNDSIIWNEAIADPAWRTLAQSRTGFVTVPIIKTGTELETAPASSELSQLIFPGSFNPPHPGHLRMFEIAQQFVQRIASYELSIMNVDKPPLDYLTIIERIERLQQTESQVYLTTAPRFIDKAILFPGATFVVGADTAIRIADTRFYNGNESNRDLILNQIAELGCRFLVFGRLVNGVFRSPETLGLPPILRQICDYIPESQFRLDISSTQIRN